MSFGTSRYFYWGTLALVGGLQLGSSSCQSSSKSEPTSLVSVPSEKVGDAHRTPIKPATVIYPEKTPIKPSQEDCGKACWNGYSIRYWARVDSQITELAPDEADRYRSLMESDFQKMKEHEDDPSFLHCVSDCQSEGTNKAVKCMIEATMESQILVCLED